MNTPIEIKIPFASSEDAQVFAERLAEENPAGLRVAQEYKPAPEGTLSTPELMEVVQLAINPAVITGVTALITNCLKHTYAFLIDKKRLALEEQAQQIERLKARAAAEEAAKRLELEKHIEDKKFEMEEKKLAFEKFKVESEAHTKRLELELREETERINAIRDIKK